MSVFRMQWNLEDQGWSFPRFEALDLPAGNTTYIVSISIGTILCIEGNSQFSDGLYSPLFSTELHTILIFFNLYF